jgi:hypothetical protein
MARTHTGFGVGYAAQGKSSYHRPSLNCELADSPQIRRFAEGKIITLVSEKINLLRARAQEPRSTCVHNDQASLQNYMSIVECTSTADSDDAVSDCVSAINERLRAIADYFATRNAAILVSASDNAESMLTGVEACHWYAYTSTSPCVHLTNIRKYRCSSSLSRDPQELQSHTQTELRRTAINAPDALRPHHRTTIGDLLFDW